MCSRQAAVHAPNRAQPPPVSSFFAISKPTSNTFLPGRRPSSQPNPAAFAFRKFLLDFGGCPQYAPARPPSKLSSPACDRYRPKYVPP